MLQSAKAVLKWSDVILAAPDGAFDQNEHAIGAFRYFEMLLSECKGPPPSLEEGIGNLAPQLLRLDRYERRAMSRRKTAMRDYDSYCIAQEGGRAAASAGVDIATAVPTKTGPTDRTVFKKPKSSGDCSSIPDDGIVLPLVVTNFRFLMLMEGQTFCFQGPVFSWGLR